MGDFQQRSQYEQYQICKERGHKAVCGVTILTDPPLSICEYCGTQFREEVIHKLVEQNVPEHIVEIPIEYESDFVNDPTTAWQSYGDIAQESEFPFFENRTAITQMVDTNRPNPKKES